MGISKYSRDLRLEETSFSDLKDLTVGKMAKADGLSFKETSNTLWWKLVLDDEIVGLGGLIKANNDTWRIKSTFVLPEWRRQSFYSVAVWLRMLKAYELDATYTESIARPASKAALKRMGYVEQDGNTKNLMRMNIKKLFDGVDVSRNPIDLFIELCPGAVNG